MPRVVTNEAKALVRRIRELEIGIDEYHARISEALRVLEEDCGSLDVASISRAVAILAPVVQMQETPRHRVGAGGRGRADETQREGR